MRSRDTAAASSRARSDIRDADSAAARTFLTQDRVEKTETHELNLAVIQDMILQARISATTRAGQDSDTTDDGIDDTTHQLNRKDHIRRAKRQNGCNLGKLPVRFVCVSYCCSHASLESFSVGVLCVDAGGECRLFVFGTLRCRRQHRNRCALPCDEREAHHTVLETSDTWSHIPKCRH